MTKHDAERKVKILDFIAATLRARGYPAVGPRDRAGRRPRLHVGRPPPPPDPRARGLPRARRRAVAGDPADADGRDPPRPRERARPAGDRRGGARRCRSSARSPPAVRSRPTRTPRRRWPSRTCSRPAATPTSCKVRGDSMIEAHIADGDFVLIRPQIDRPQRRHRRRPGRGERGHPQALLQGEGPDPAPAGQPELPAAVLRRRPHPGQAHRGHPTARLTAAARCGPAALPAPRSLTHASALALVLAGRLGLNRRAPIAVGALDGYPQSFHSAPTSGRKSWTELGG